MILPTPYNLTKDVVISVSGVSKKYSINRNKDINIDPTLFRDFLKQTIQKFFKQPQKIFKRTNAPSAPNFINFWALRDISFEVLKGDRIGIIGNNGAGKSTLLKILSQVIPPSFGEIKIFGTIASLLEVGTGFHPELTGRENIYLNGAILGMSKQEVRNKFDEIVNFSGVREFLDVPVKRYSSGMYVRLAFSVAVHLDSDILILDEVLAVGDTSFQKKCLIKMSEISASGRTIIFVSHNMNSISEFCNKVIWLESGQIKGFGKTQKMIDSYSDIFSLDGLIGSASRDNEGLSVEGVGIYNSHGEKNTIFSADEDIHIAMKIILSHSICGIYARIAILTLDGTHILVSDSTDCVNDGASIQDLSEGKYSIGIKLPKRTLAAGDYYLSLDLLKYDSECWHSSNMLVSLHKVACITIRDNSTNLGASRGGFVGSLLTWSAEKRIE